jgi:hypothetical protein
MKVYAHHDPTGAIQAIIGVDGPEGVGGMLQPEPGVLVTELEAAGLQLDPDALDDLRDFVERHKVELRPASPNRLVPKD